MQVPIQDTCSLRPCGSHKLQGKTGVGQQGLLRAEAPDPDIAWRPSLWPR